MEQPQFNRILLGANILVASLLIFAQILTFSFLNKKIEKKLTISDNLNDQAIKEEEPRTLFSTYSNSDFQFKVEYLKNLSWQELETTDDKGEGIKDLVFSLGFLNPDSNSYAYSLYVFKSQSSAQDFLSQFLKSRFTKNENDLIFYEDEKGNSLILRNLNDHFFILSQEDARPADFKNFNDSLKSTQITFTNCLQTFERKTNLENNFRNNFYAYSFNQFDLNNFKKLAGIKNWCLPPDYINLLEGPDWNTNYRNKTYRSESGRKVILGMEKYLNQEKEKGEVLIEYSTYNFVANSEFNTYATKSDYVKAKNNPNLEEINRHKVYIKFGKVLENNEYVLEKTYLFPKSFYYLNLSYHFPKHYSNNEEGLKELEKDLKNLEEGNMPEDRKKDLELLEMFARSIEFNLEQ
jgi:hypothetical protein